VKLWFSSGIEHFHQCRGRIAAKIGGHLIHFIEDEDWIDGAGLLHHLDDLAGQRADIGASMPANFASSRTPPSDTRTNFRAGGVAMDMAKRGLPTPEPDEAQNRALRVLDQLAHGEESRMRSFTFSGRSARGSGCLLPL